MNDIYIGSREEEGFVNETLKIYGDGYLHEGKNDLKSAEFVSNIYNYPDLFVYLHKKYNILKTIEDEKQYRRDDDDYDFFNNHVPLCSTQKVYFKPINEETIDKGLKYLILANNWDIYLIDDNECYGINLDGEEKNVVDGFDFSSYLGKHEKSHNDYKVFRVLN